MKDFDVSKLTQEQLDAHFVLSVRQNDGMAEFWLRNGANVNGRFEWNESVLIYAIQNDNEELAVKLIEAGIDVNGTDRFKDPILFYALDDVKWLNILAKGNLNINARTNRYGETALSIAYKENNEKIFDRLIELGIDVNVPMVTGKYPALIYDIVYRDGKWVDKLIKANVDVNSKDGYGTPALMLAIRYEYTDVITKLIDAKADVNLSDSNEETPLMMAYKYWTVQKLIESGADVNAVNYLGETALIQHVKDYALLRTDEESKIIELLLQSGADTSVVTRNGDTALSIACRTKYKDLIGLIKAYSGK